VFPVSGTIEGRKGRHEPSSIFNLLNTSAAVTCAAVATNYRTIAAIEAVVIVAIAIVNTIPSTTIYTTYHAFSSFTTPPPPQLLVKPPLPATTPLSPATTPKLNFRSLQTASFAVNVVEKTIISAGNHCFVYHKAQSK
jgi:hypothetical protein